MTSTSGPRRVLVTGGSGFIGTHLSEALLGHGVELLNADIAAPQLDHHRPYWHEVDILDRDKLIRTVNGFAPTEVVHLAARTDMKGTAVSDYQTNTVGTLNVVDSIRAAGPVRRAVFTSSQFVCGHGTIPKDDEEYAPHTVYGRSKVEGERIVRAADLDATWTIVRPTNVWGPWHPRYPTEFWHVLRRGLYVHPGSQPVVRCYGYVRNVVWQIERILEAEDDLVGKRVFYVGDPPIVLREWVDAFSRAITGRPVRVVPRWVVRGLGRVGDAARAFGVPFPIYSSRVRSMTENYATPMQATLETIGTGPVSLQEGVAETVGWLRERQGW